MNTQPPGALRYGTFGAVFVGFAIAACSSEPPSIGRASSALTDEDAVRAECKGTYKNHGQCVACVAHASAGGELVSQFAQGECHDRCIRTSCAVEGKSCGRIPDGCDGFLTCGPSCEAQPIFAADENHATYEVRAVCRIDLSSSVGTDSSCCRTGTIGAETTCTTVLHEERDAAGKLIVRIDPMAGCQTTATDVGCNRSGELARCDRERLVCPIVAGSNPPYSNPGTKDPAVLVGTYVRKVIQVGSSVEPFDEYRGGCGDAAIFRGAAPSCVRPTPETVGTLSTFTKVAPGKFAVRRAWGGQGSSRGLCTNPILMDLNTFPNTKFIEGWTMGGSFGMAGYECTYELTKNP